MIRARAQGSKPDLVDRAALAERLGVSPETVSRWYRRSTLPEPDLRVGKEELWLWETVRQWSRARSRFTWRQRPRLVVDVVDLAELADRVGIDGRTADNWRRSGFLPQPDFRWETTDAWLWETVDQWVSTTLALRMPCLIERPPQESNAMPGGPRLRIPETTELVEQPRKPDLPLVESSTAAPPAEAVEVTPVRQLSPDPIGDIERIQRYFAEMAQTWSGSAADF